jgi:hypothetical protein
MNAYNVKDSVTVILFSPSFGTCIYILSTYSSSTYYIYLGITHSGPWKRVVLDLSHTLLRSLPSKGGQNTRYPIPEPEPRPEVPDHNFG